MKARESTVTIELNARERRLYDRVRRAIVSHQPGEPSGLRDALLLLPDLTVLLARLLRDPRVPIGAKGIALFGIGYVLAPIDLMPALLLGPIGFADDLFVVAATLSRLLNYVHPDVVRSHWAGQGDALDAIQRATRWAETCVKGALARLVPSLLRRS